MNVEYKNAGIDCVTLSYPDTKEDLGQALISEGWALVERRRERRLSKLVTDYIKAQEKAKSARVTVHILSLIIC